jgi:transcriptional regulator with XRE-family HTH domain
MSSRAATARSREDAELRRWIGRQIHEQRLEAGVTQAQLAACAGVDPSFLSRIEAGITVASIPTLAALAKCLGCELSVRLYPTAGPRLHDRLQAPMVEALIAALGPAWRARPEVPVPAARGVIDVVLSRSLDHLTVACECHSELRRLEEVLRRANEKADALHASTPGGATSRLLILRSTRLTREVATTYGVTLAAAYPARTADALEALRGRAAWPGAAVVWMHVAAGGARIMDGPPRGVRVGR